MIATACGLRRPAAAEIVARKRGLRIGLKLNPAVKQLREIATALGGGQDGKTAAGRGLVKAGALIIGKEEQLVLLDGTADRTAELVPAQQRIGKPLKLLAQLLALNWSFRKNSNRPP